VVRRATERFKQRFKVIDVDGARIQFADGWGLVRASNTQPALVLRFETSTEQSLQQNRRLVEDELARIRTEVEGA
jgi:phosphomannomutase/phosphoglucomutase